MRVALDLDGTIDADPVAFQGLMAALRAAGHVVYVLTGGEEPTVTPKKLQQKINYLCQLGCGDCWDHIAIFGDPPHRAKAEYCKKHNISLLIDNDLRNARFASNHCTVLVPWNSRVPRESD